MSNRPKYKQLYLQEKARREWMDKHAPDALAKYLEFDKRRRQLVADMEYAFLAGRF